MADAIKMATKRKHHEVTLKVKYEALDLKKVGLIKVLRTNSVFLVVLLLLGRKTEKIFEAFQNSSLKRQSENWNIGKVK